MARLRDLAKLIRSKNAGPFLLTFDILFDDVDVYQSVVRSKAITRATVATAYGIEESRIISLYEVTDGLAIKLTMRRLQPQCAPGERDVYGCQQHAPLMGLEVPIGGNY